jgi:peptidase M23
MNLGSIKDKSGKADLKKTTIKRICAAAAVCCVAVIAVTAAVSLTNKQPQEEIPVVVAPTPTDSAQTGTDVQVVPDDNSADKNNTETGNDKTDTQTSNNVSVAQKMLLPVSSGNVLKGYAADMLVYSSTLKHWATHTALDIAAEQGAEVFAALDGKVTKVEEDDLMGLTITIDHDDGYQTVYASLDSLANGIAEGATVLRGQVIGAVGTSAAAEVDDGPHLHFEVYSDGAIVNPQTYLSDLIK